MKAPKCTCTGWPHIDSCALYWYLRFNELMGAAQGVAHLLVALAPSEDSAKTLKALRILQDAIVKVGR